ncbi:hypothetical protein [cf. Phormidesmis sp. LEGE 11477]|uniref:hypothetical protein n=1 Tax=cf. Phormidesmis sp. LEGE 11477 TaxID=1828680 RepID=UPI001D14690B|nr:hypothetical protein [cf. Phormidesmis sp. LEGE 11477]
MDFESGSPSPTGSKGLGDEGSIALHKWDAPRMHPYFAIAYGDQEFVDVDSIRSK